MIERFNHYSIQQRSASSIDAHHLFLAVERG